MLRELTELIEKECRNAVEYDFFGTQDFHIEKIERIADKKCRAFKFLVTTWNNLSSTPRKTEEMGLFEIMDLLGRVIGHSAVIDSVKLVRKFEENN